MFMWNLLIQVYKLTWVFDYLQIALTSQVCTEHLPVWHCLSCFLFVDCRCSLGKESLHF